MKKANTNQNSHKKPVDLVYGLDDTPPAAVLVPLVLQQVVNLCGNLIYPVLIVTAVGGSAELAQSFVTIMLIATGIGTILQAWRKGRLGSGFLCAEETSSMYFPASVMAVKTGGFSLLFGMTVIAGLAEMFLSTVLHRLRFLFPPEVTGLVVAVTGISIIRTGLTYFFGVTMDGERLTYDLPSAVAALITLAIMVSINIWGRKTLRQYSVLCGMLTGYLASYALGILTDDHLAKLRQTPLLTFPQMSHLSWSFNADLMLPFAIAVLCSSIKTIGNITTCQKSNDANWIRLDMETTRGGLMAEGLGTAISGLIGGMGLSGSSGSIGLSIATGATSRRIAFVLGGTCLILAFFPQLSSLFAIMPKPVMGTILIFNVSFIVLAGLQILTSRMLDARKTFVIGLSLIFGLGADIMPELYHSFPEWLQPLLKSSLTSTAIMAIILNWVFRIGIASQASIEIEPGVDTSGKIFNFMEERGKAWGAIPGVIRKAASAISEFIDLAAAAKLTGQKIMVKVKFDEFNLDVEIYYQGTLLNFSSTRPTEDELLSSEDAYIKLAGYLITRYANRVRTEIRGGQCLVQFHFEH